VYKQLKDQASYQRCGPAPGEPSAARAYLVSPSGSILMLIHDMILDTITSTLSRCAQRQRVYASCMTGGVPYTYLRWIWQA